VALSRAIIRLGVQLSPERQKHTLSTGVEANLEPVDFDTVKEDWNIYKLHDGTEVKIKLVTVGIALALDNQGNQIYNEGETMVVVKSKTLISVHPPGRL
jgi:hypothetical protein